MQKYIFIFSLFIASQALGENPEVLRCSEAAIAFKEKQYAKAHELAQKTCPALKDLSRWKQLRYAQGDVNFSDYVAFVEHHGHWPWIGDVRKAAERFLSFETPPRQVIKWFSIHHPKSFEALEIYLKALKRLNKRDLYKSIILREWERMSLTLDQEARLLSLGEGVIRQEQHLKRLKHFLAKKQYQVARRQIDRCTPSIHSYLRVRLAFCEGRDEAPQLYTNLKTHERRRLDIIEDYFSYLQNKESPQSYSFIEKHKALLEQAPERFWRLRYIVARDALVIKDYEKVFKALDHRGLTKGQGYIESQYLLGFVALRFLDDPDLALRYFEPAYKHLTNAGPLARFAYWMGRAYEKKGNMTQAQKWFGKAKEHPQTFYGQESFKATDQDLELSFFRLHYKEEEREKVLTHPFVRYTQLLKSLESHQDIAPFLYKIYYTLKGNGEKRAFLDFCHREYPEYVYDMARLMGVVYVYKETYPVLPETKGAQDPALINAIIRKESGFNPYAISGAGAQGLMQLMPKTAQIIAKDIGLKIDVADLTKNPEVNVKLGTAYFEQKLTRFQGNKEITLSGYNAGPLYSDKWLKRYGDPRLGEIDLLTWIELIPFSETRSYIRRVMANYGVYQKLLAD
ncbi:MAG TPA: hypothetical protein DD412_01055 [Holosporales bacterium]|nr:hypothetical protein [Holosporales bacterium]